MGIVLDRARHDKEEREFHAARFKEAPEPVVVNVDAVLVLGQPREFQWGGVGYRAPPLSYEVGLRLLVAANALADLRAANAPESVVSSHLNVAARLIRKAISPIRWYRRGWLRSFTTADPDELQGLLYWLVYVPDKGAMGPPAKRQIRLDYMDLLAEFARAFPAWTIRRGWFFRESNGFPLSWAHYLYGMRHLSRFYAREETRNAISARAGQADEKSWKEHLAGLREAAGW